MKLPPLTITNLKRYTNTLFMVKEYIYNAKIDEHKPLSDTLLVAIYGIEEVISDLEKFEYENHIKEKLKSDNQISQ